MNTGRGKKRSAQAHESKELHSIKNVIKDIHAAYTPLGSVTSVSFRGLVRDFCKFCSSVYSVRDRNI